MDKVTAPPVKTYLTDGEYVIPSSRVQALDFELGAACSVADDECESCQ